MRFSKERRHRRILWKTRDKILDPEKLKILGGRKTWDGATLGTEFIKI